MKETMAEIKKLIAKERGKYPITTTIWTNELINLLDQIGAIIENPICEKWIKKRGENKMVTWEKENIFKRVIKGTDEEGHLFYRTLGAGFICILDNGKALGWSDNSPEEALKWAQQNVRGGEGCKM